ASAPSGVRKTSEPTTLVPAAGDAAAGALLAGLRRPRLRVRAAAAGPDRRQLAAQPLEVVLGVLVRRVELHRRLEVVDAPVDRRACARARRLGVLIGEDAEHVVDDRVDAAVLAVR